jgi:hypothetical protein
MPLSYFVSRLFRSSFLLPFLSAMVAWYPFLIELRRSMWHAFVILLFWTFVQSLMVIIAALKDPEGTVHIIWNGRSYSTAMMKWIDTGMLPEGSTFDVFLIHLKQTLLFCLLALISGNLLSLVLGSALLNYMNVYVAHLANSCPGARARAFWMGWNPWSAIRVLAFLWLGVVLSVPILSHFISLSYSFSFPALFIGLAGVALDFIMKILIAKAWSKRLKLMLRKSPQGTIG